MAMKIGSYRITFGLSVEREPTAPCECCDVGVELDADMEALMLASLRPDARWAELATAA